MKKQISILLSLLLLAGLFVSAPYVALAADETPVNPIPDYVAMPQGSTELIKNGGFESGWSSPSNWNHWNGESGVTYTYEKSGGRSGRGVRMQFTGSATPFLTQSIANPVVGATYQGSFWYKIDSASANPGFKVECYSQSSGMLQGVWVKKAPYPNQSSEWRRHVYHFTIPKDCVRFTFFIRVYGTSGTESNVLFDDVSCYKIADPVKYPAELSTDQVFYYSDMTEGAATISFNTTDFPNVKSADVTIKNASNAVYQSTTITKGTANTYTWAFPLSGMVEKDAYTITVTGKDASGNALGMVSTQKIHKYPRPSLIGTDGNIYIDGVQFNPTFVYHMAKADLQYAPQIGVNVSQQRGSHTNVDTIRAYLDEAAKYGVKCIIPLYVDMKPAGHADNVANTTNVVSSLKDHPGVLAWMVMDEAGSYYPDDWDLFYDSYKLIRDLDSVHPVYILQNTPTLFGELAKYADILAYDVYPGYNELPTKVTTNTAKAVAAVSGNKPVWSLNKAYGTLAGSEDTRPLPTIMEERNMWYQSLMTGASAVGYYSYSDGYGGAPLHTIPSAQNDLYTGLQTFKNAEQAESINLFLNHKYKIFAEGTTEDARYTAYIKDGKLRIVILNRHESQKTVSIPLTSDGGAVEIGAFSASRVYGGSGTAEGNGTLSVTLEPCAAYVYEITPTEEVDYTGLRKTKFHDLDTETWAAEAIRHMEAREMLEGTSAMLFSPGEKVTKATFATWLGRALGTTVSATAAEMTKAEMLDMIETALSSNPNAATILAEVSTAIAAQPNFTTSTTETLTRAEAAFALREVYIRTNEDIDPPEEDEPEEEPVIPPVLQTPYTIDFEEASGTKASTLKDKGWTLLKSNNQNATYKNLISDEASIVHGGTYALKYYANNTNTKLISPVLSDLSDSETYMLSAWVYRDTGADATASVKLVYSGGTSETITTNLTEGQWTNLVGVFKVPEGETAQLYIMGCSTQYKTHYWDDIVISLAQKEIEFTFEGGISDWTKSVADSNTVLAESTTAHGGTKSLSVMSKVSSGTAPTNTEGAVRFAVSRGLTELIPGETYKLTAWYNVNNSYLAYSKLKIMNGSELLGEASITNSLGEWKKVEAEFTVPQEASPSNIKLWLPSAGMRNNACLWDDIVIKPISTASYFVDSVELEGAPEAGSTITAKVKLSVLEGDVLVFAAKYALVTGGEQLAEIKVWNGTDDISFTVGKDEFIRTFIWKPLTEDFIPVADPAFETLPAA